MSENKETRFDAFAENYRDVMQTGLGQFGDVDYYSMQKARLTCRWCAVQPGRVLDYGCGTGGNLAALCHVFPAAEVCGCDVSEKSLATAKADHPAVNFFSVGDECMEKTFDLVFIANVLHHVLPQDRTQFMEQVCTHVRPGGEIFIFEHNPFNPVTKRIVDTCPLDEDAVLLMPRETTRLCSGVGLRIQATRFTLFFPPRLKRLDVLERFLGWIPMGGQYMVQATKP
ncbi:class I SAM-dependent methyltransferase [Desulfovibrio inopinatus]|uniref:class I SAM-dependent methyltransferase n=1 Tax=Desulfovibrio inopinatus TaxID=102109 RepID=UPI0003FC18FC|nr:class I SAM-dependent methyltransferase [Desulfovibrio inopinatus]